MTTDNDKLKLLGGLAMFREDGDRKVTDPRARANIEDVRALEDGDEPEPDPEPEPRGTVHTSDLDPTNDGPEPAPKRKRGRRDMSAHARPIQGDATAPKVETSTEVGGLKSRCEQCEDDRALLFRLMTEAEPLMAKLAELGNAEAQDWLAEVRPLIQ